MSLQKSTIVRTFGFLERNFPGVGAVFAERLWCSPPRSKKVAEIPKGTKASVKVNGTDVVYEVWGEGPKVYLMHGWGGHRGQLAPFIKPFTDKGYQVIALDAPSHGESGAGAFGRGRGLITEFALALEAVVDVNGPAHTIIAHSGGGMAAALAVLDGLSTPRLVMIGAMADVLPYTVEFARELGFGERIRTGFLKRLEERVGRPMEDFSIPHRARVRTDLPALLIVHDTEDKEVHYRDAVMLHGAWRGAEIMTTTGLGHRRILADTDVISHVLSHASS